MATSKAVGIRALAVLLPVMAAACVLGCSHKPAHVLSVRELATALRAHGVAYTVEETAALTHVKAHGLRLTGKDLDVNVYRIDDEKERKATATAAQQAQAASAQTAGAKPLQALMRGPFLVVVRAEPSPGLVANALSQVLPEPPGAPAGGATR